MSKSIKNNLKELRFKQNRMTQEQLANKVNVTRQTILAIENNKYSPSLELAFKIADVFGVSINNVFFYVEQNENN